MLCCGPPGGRLQHALWLSGSNANINVGNALISCMQTSCAGHSSQVRLPADCIAPSPSQVVHALCCHAMLWSTRHSLPTCCPYRAVSLIQLRMPVKPAAGPSLPPCKCALRSSMEAKSAGFLRSRTAAATVLQRCRGTGAGLALRIASSRCRLAGGGNTSRHCSCQALMMS